MLRKKIVFVKTFLTFLLCSFLSIKAVFHLGTSDMTPYGQNRQIFLSFWGSFSLRTNLICYHLFIPAGSDCLFIASLYIEKFRFAEGSHILHMLHMSSDCLHTSIDTYESCFPCLYFFFCFFIFRIRKNKKFSLKNNSTFNILTQSE